MHKIFKFIFLSMMLFSVSDICADEKYLKMMGDAYLGLISYSDKGSILRYRIADGPKENDVSEFTTKYTRPNELEFIWRKKNHYTGKIKTRTIVENDDSLTMYRSGRPAEKFKSKISILSALVGLTSGASFLAPHFLDYGYMDENFERIESVMYKGEEEVNHHICDVVKVKYKQGGIETLWIDKKTNLLRRLEEVSYPKHAKQGIHTIIEYTMIKTE